MLMHANVCVDAEGIRSFGADRWVLVPSSCQRNVDRCSFITFNNLVLVGCDLKCDWSREMLPLALCG